jgi:hypothetical protein
MEILYLFLEFFFSHGICCHPAGPFVAFLAGVLEFFRSVNVYVALTDHPLLNLVFQRVPVPIPNFTVDAFDYELTYIDDVYDILMYVRFLDMNVEFSSYGIDSLNCGPDSNIDFIHFAWLTFERYNFRNCVVALIPSDDNSEPPMMRYLRDYRANSEGWRDFGNCADCVTVYRDYMRPFSNCRAPAALCSCNICNRQPLSLRDSAFHTIFQQIDISRFELTPHTTYDEYAYTVRSNRASVDGLPPEYPAVRLWFMYDPSNFNLKTHAECPGAGQWQDESAKFYGSTQEVFFGTVKPEGPVLVPTL